VPEPYVSEQPAQAPSQRLPQPCSSSAAGTVEAGKRPPPVEEEDPWPDVFLSPSPVGLEDGSQRADELRRRGDFSGAARMHDKVVYVARRSRPVVVPARMAELLMAQAQANALAGQWERVLSTCDSVDALREGGVSALTVAQLHCCRARSLLETKSIALAEEAHAGLTKALAHETQTDEDWETVQDECRDLQACIQQAKTLPERTSVALAACAAPAAASSATALPAAPAAPPFVTRDRAPTPPCNIHSDDPSVAYNQAFFDHIENDYAALCKEDGWDEICQTHEGPHAKPNSNAAPRQIPLESDYYRVQLPHGADRELRCAPKTQPVVAVKNPTKPRRNLEELRRVEAAAREAMEKERARIEESTDTAPIRTKSDTVVLDSLSDSDEERDVTAKEDKAKVEKVYAVCEMMQEFERRGHEKEERLAMWRERWG